VGFLFVRTVPAPVAFSAQNPLLVKSTPVLTPLAGVYTRSPLDKKFFLVFSEYGA
jgi:hypothetical protein